MKENDARLSGGSYSLPMTRIQEQHPMNTSQTSFLSEIENGEPIPLGKLAYLRERTRNLLYDFIVRKFVDAESDGLTQAELARRIGKRPEVVNRMLGSPGNWRIDTISDLLVGIAGEELQPASKSLLNRSPRNFLAPDWLTEIRSRPTEDIVDAEDILRRKTVPLNDDAISGVLPNPIARQG